MSTELLALDEDLAGARRFPARLGRGAGAIVLLGAGATAAAATLLPRLHLGLPGHAIVLTMAPIALGLALAPRRAAGSLMASGALATAVALRAGGLASGGVAAIVGAVAAGLLLDGALRAAPRSRRAGIAIVAASVGSNAAAFATRAVVAALGLDARAHAPSWWAMSAGSHLACAVVAGLLVAAAWFRADPPRGAA